MYCYCTFSGQIDIGIDIAKALSEVLLLLIFTIAHVCWKLLRLSNFKLLALKAHLALKAGKFKLRALNPSPTPRGSNPNVQISKCKEFLLKLHISPKTRVIGTLEHMRVLNIVKKASILERVNTKKPSIP